MMLYLCNFTLGAFGLDANIFGPLHSPGLHVRQAMSSPSKVGT